MLAETDFYALSDVTMTDAMTTYRQALRDITAHSNFPHNLTDDDWPTKPWTMNIFILVLVIGGISAISDCDNGGLCFQEKTTCEKFAQRIISTFLCSSMKILIFSIWARISLQF